MPLSTRELISGYYREIRQLNERIEAQLISMRHLREENQRLKYMSPSVIEAKRESVALLQRLAKSYIEVSKLTRTIRYMEVGIEQAETYHSYEIEQLEIRLRESALQGETAGSGHQEQGASSDLSFLSDGAQPSVLTLSYQYKNLLASERLPTVKLFNPSVATDGFCNLGITAGSSSIEQRPERQTATPEIRVDELNVLPEIDQICHIFSLIPQYLKAILQDQYHFQAVSAAIESFSRTLYGKFDLNFLISCFDSALERYIKQYLTRYFALTYVKRICVPERLYDSDERDCIELVFVMNMTFLLVSGASVTAGGFLLGEEKVEM